MINGPHLSQHINRIQPVDGDRADDQPDERKRRRVLYQGRAWAETEEELPVQPAQATLSTPTKGKPRTSAGIFANPLLLERAQALLRLMTTLEEKVAQLCFYETDAVYDAALQHEVELLIQTWQIGGVLFKKGDYKRQSYLIENNKWGMGTHVSRALSFPERIAEHQAASYNMEGYTLNGMDYFNCYAGFEHIHKQVLKTSRPVLVECVCERFKGHSISDPGLYRSKEELQSAMKKDPIPLMKHILEEEGLLTEEDFKVMDKEAKQKVIEAMAYAEKSPWPSPATLEEDVYAP